MLDTISDLLKTEFFTARRELGIINVGGSGKVEVNGDIYQLEREEALYIGKGEHNVTFYSNDAANPAKFYLNSAPAHHAYPCKKVGKQEANVLAHGVTGNM